MLEYARALAGVLLAVVLANPAQAQGSAPEVELPGVTIEQFLPVRTARMTVGSFEAERRSTGVAQPFFLIGCDNDSLAWLEQNRARLLEFGAFGLVIEASDIHAYRRLESKAQGLVLRPVAGDLIAEHLRIRRYPALVTSEGIFP